MLFLVLFAITKASLPDNAEYQLKRKLFENYDRTTRPVLKMDDTLVMNFSIAIRALVDLDVEAAKISVSVWMYYFWRDYNLIWNPEDYDHRLY